MRIHIIDGARRAGTDFDTTSHLLTRGHWMPVLLCISRLADLGFSVGFYDGYSEESLDCDSLIVTSRYHDHLRGSEQVEGRGASLSALRAPHRKLIWFDLRDSSGTPQFEVLDYVDLYVKQCLLKERSHYSRAVSGGRIFTEFMQRRFGVEDPEPDESAANQEDSFTPLEARHADRVVVGWDLSYRFQRTFVRRADEAAWLTAHLQTGRPDPLEYEWTPPARRRPIDVAAMMSTDIYPRPSIAFQRREALRLLRGAPALRAQLEPVEPYSYFATLCDAKLALSCFGNGEICYREHEAWLAGTAVVMPDMSHLETYPLRYIPGETYQPLQWDLSDLLPCVRSLLSDEERRLHLAHEGQRRYRALFSGDGLDQFADRFARLASGKAPDPIP